MRVPRCWVNGLTEFFPALRLFYSFPMNEPADVSGNLAPTLVFLCVLIC